MDTRPRIRTKHPGIAYRERADGSRQYMFWYTDSAGKPHWKNVDGGEREAKQARARVVDKMARGEKIIPNRVLFADFARKWLKQQTNLKPKTLETYEWAIEKHLVPKIGERRKLSQIDVNVVAQFIKDMQGKKAWTIRACLTPLSGIMRSAVRSGLTPVNPVTQLERSERPQGDQARMNILDTDEIKLLLNAATETYKGLLATAIFTGLRIGELLALKWEDLGWEDGVIHVHDSKTRAGVREVVLMPALQQILATHSLAHEGSVYVFETWQGQQMKRRTVARRALEDTLTRAKIEKRIRFHDLRHTFASILISQGHDWAYISEQMGHSSIATTLRIYGHLMDRHKKREEAREKMEAAYGEVLG